MGWMRSIVSTVPAPVLRWTNTASFLPFCELQRLQVGPPPLPSFHFLQPLPVRAKVHVPLKECGRKLAGLSKGRVIQK